MGLDYLQYYLFNPTQVNLFPMFFLVLGRVLPIMSMAPFFGAKVLNRPARIGFGIVLYFVLFPVVVSTTTGPLGFNVEWVALMIKEMFIGITIGLLSSMPFYIAESSGVLIDFQRGASSLMTNDPIIQSQNSPIGVMFNMLGVVLFFWTAGPFLFLDALIQSYRVIPCDVFFSSLFFTEETGFWKTIMGLLGTEMRVAVQLAAPSLIVMFMTDMFLGLANRLAPQVMITFLGMPLKSLLGLGMLWLAWFIILKQFALMNIQWVGKIGDLIEWFKVGLPLTGV